MWHTVCEMYFRVTNWMVWINNTLELINFSSRTFVSTTLASWLPFGFHLYLIERSPTRHQKLRTYSKNNYFLLSFLYCSSYSKLDMWILSHRIFQKKHLTPGITWQSFIRWLLQRLVSKKCSNTCSRLFKSNWGKTKFRQFAPSLIFSALRNKPKVPIRDFQILLLRQHPSLMSSWIIINIQKDNYNVLETFLPESILT